MSPRSTFADRLRQALQDRRMSQSNLAKKLELSESAVSQWMSGKKMPSSDTIEALATELDVPAGWLAFDDGEGPKLTFAEDRRKYKDSTGWIFRSAAIDGGRDYGNANLWSVPWDINTLVRETLQNSLDAAIDPIRGIKAVFTLIRLEGKNLKNFLSALQWKQIGIYPGLSDHIKNSSSNGHKLGNILMQGLTQLKAEKELVLLRIDDYKTVGLRGEEDGEGNFVALCRNNLDSSKDDRYAGGSYGLGKAVFWRASRFATVIFNSDLNDIQKVEGALYQKGRLIGKSELAWHKIQNNSYAGPGWFGEVQEVDGGNRSASIWNNKALAHDLYLRREEDTPGTSILVVGFYDAASDEPDNLEKTAVDIEKAIANNFWPALINGKLEAQVRTMEGRQERLDIRVDPERYVGEFIDAYRKFERKEVVEQLEQEGDVVRKIVPLSIPGREKEPSHPSIVHEAVLVVRRESSLNESASDCPVHFFRGQHMVIMEKKWSNLVFGGSPFRAFVMCGLAGGSSDNHEFGDIFLRSAEPPAHDRWELTPELKIDYAIGSGTRLREFFQEVRDQIRDLIKPTYDERSPGPDSLKRLLRLSAPEPPRDVPKVIVNSDETYVDDDESWVVEATVWLPESREWIISPVLRFEAETGGGKRVEWRLEAIQDCEIDGGDLIIPRGKREAVFRGRSNPETHPAPSKDTAVRVLLHRIRY